MNQCQEEGKSKVEVKTIGGNRIWRSLEGLGGDIKVVDQSPKSYAEGMLIILLNVS